MLCYNFISPCKDYFTTSGARDYNQVFFILGNLKDQTINR